MKSFYEMVRILEESKGIKEGWGADYGAGDMDGPPVSFTRVLGEDGDEPFSIEVDYHDGEWKPFRGTSSLFVRKEAGAAGSSDEWDEYKNPGKNLMNVPEPIRSRALAWIESELEWYAAHWKPEDPRDYEEREPYNDDPDGHRYWDRYWSTGPGRDPD